MFAQSNDPKVGPVVDKPSELISSWLQSRAERFGADGALSTTLDNADQERITFSELNFATKRLASSLSTIGLVPGDAIAIWLPNRPLWMVVHFAAVLAGLTTIPLNTWYREAEIRHFLNLTKARAVIVDSTFRGIDFATILNNALSRMDGNQTLEWLIDVADSANTECGQIQSIGLSDLPRHAAVKSLGCAGENIAAITFATSGTTALPKLAVHRESALITHANAIVARSEISRSDKVLCVLPPCGAYGYTLIMTALSAGASAIQVPSHDLDQLVHAIGEHQITIMAVTEPLIRAILDHPMASRESLASLRLVFSAGATLEDVVRRAEVDFGFRLTNVYGSSEVLAFASFWPSDADVLTRASAGGKLVSPGMRVRIAGDFETEVADGDAGELQFHGPIVTMGYFADEKATHSAMTEDGWFRSNDLGIVDDLESGVFRFIARQGDALRIRGFLVSPSEIEGKLLSHPDVAGAQVVGVSDGRGEELAVAFVELKATNDATASSLREFCGQDMASYKVPAFVQILDRFPTTRSANGDKVVKGRLREMAKELIQHG